jgi:hypothetical protein
MALLIDALLCAGLALIVFSLIGFALAGRIAPPQLAVLMAPGLGWAVHSALALPLYFVIGLSSVTATLVLIVPALVAVFFMRAQFRAAATTFSPAVVIALIGMTLLACVVMAGILPKFIGEGVTLASPIFDHSKVAMIDEMIRLGVPPGNPFFGAAGSAARLSYYYLWHFSAAELALFAHVSGWEADAGLAWFTAFASLSSVIGFAVWLSGRASAAIWIVGLASTASVRPLLNALFGLSHVEDFAGYQSGFGGWLFQTSWAPQHMASAMCALMSIYLLVNAARRPGIVASAIFGVTMAAGFECSTWIGGIAFPLAAIPVALVMLEQTAPRDRLRVVLALGAAAVLALILISPFLYDQLATTALRGARPIAVMPYRVLGDRITAIVGSMVNLPAYWLIFLLVEFPAFYLTGVIALFFILKDRTLDGERKPVVVAFALTTAVSLVTAWLLVSTLGENNDLGWRAVLPAVLMLMIFAAVGLTRLMQRPASPLFVAAIVLILLGVPEAVMMGYGNVVVAPNASSKAFAASPALWQAVRRYSGEAERVANNPAFLGHMTPWSANISWALLSDRRSCDAGPSFLGPFTALSNTRQDQVSALFTRVFAGDADADDVAQLAVQFNCSVAVVTPQDGAWTRDPFASSSYYRLVENTAAWRIYKIVKLAAR